MPQIHNAPNGDIQARPFGPLDNYPAAAAGLPTRMDQPHSDMPAPDPVTICELFERTGTGAWTSFDPAANNTVWHAGVARRATKRPRNPARSHADAAGAGSRTEAATAMRVLVVEDDAIIGTLLAEMLAGMGHDVCAIEATEADAVSAAARCKPDLMIVDVGLGEGSGVSAVETIYRTGPVPHVFVSGAISGLQALRPGSIFIRKPYREADLARVIQQALDAASIQ